MSSSSADLEVSSGPAGLGGDRLRTSVRSAKQLVRQLVVEVLEVDLAGPVRPRGVAELDVELDW